MINERQARKFCGEDLSAIENYEQAVNDKTQVWDIHHRLEIQGPFTNSRELLKKRGLYYGVPASQLVFMTRAEHTRLHSKGKRLSEETKQKLSEAHKGRPLSEEAKRKMSEVRKGKRHSEETRRKMSEAHKGQSNGMLGKRHSEDTKRKMAEARREYWRKRKTAMSK